MDYVKDVDPHRFASLGAQVFGVDPAGKDVERLAAEAIARVREFFASIGAPQRLRDYDIGPADLPRLAGQAVRFGDIGQFRKLGASDVLAILRSAL